MKPMEQSWVGSDTGAARSVELGSAALIAAEFVGLDQAELDEADHADDEAGDIGSTKEVDKAWG
jgi:hypothetical protein